MGLALVGRLSDSLPSKTLLICTSTDKWFSIRTPLVFHRFFTDGTRREHHRSIGPIRQPTHWNKLSQRSGCSRPTLLQCRNWRTRTKQASWTLQCIGIVDVHPVRGLRSSRRKSLLRTYRPTVAMVIHSRMHHQYHRFCNILLLLLPSVVSSAACQRKVNDETT